jgi:hypothetical protein
MFSYPKKQFHLNFKKYISEKSECSICYDEVENNNIIQTDCNHHYCIPCFKKYLSIKKENNTNLTCPYCRQHIKSVSLNNQEETQHIIDDFCTEHNTFTLFYPITIDIYNDLYTNGMFDLYGNPISTNDNNELNDLIVIVIYPIVSSVLLFIYMCFMISIDKRLIYFLVIVLGLWYILYTLLNKFYHLNVAECYFIGWFSLIAVGTSIIVYT